MVRRRFAAARASCSSAECTDCVGVDESRVPNRAATPIPAGAALTDNSGSMRRRPRRAAPLSRPSSAGCWSAIRWANDSVPDQRRTSD